MEDRCGVLAELTSVFAKNHVSVAQIIQKDAKSKEEAEIVVITSRVREGDIQKALSEIATKECVRKVSAMIRVYAKENE